MATNVELTSAGSDDVGAVRHLPEDGLGAGGLAGERLDETAAVALGGRLQALAGAAARLDHEFCGLVAQFDAGEGIGWYRGVKSTAHFLAWACAMTPSVAREHVRVARALRRMPVTDAAFADGRLSYSKVRELTRLVGECDEAALVELAVESTASQLARTVSAYRTAAGTRLTAAVKRYFTMQPRGDGMVRLSVCLPAEDAAVIAAAVEASGRRGCRSAGGGGAEQRDPGVPAGTSGVDQVQALVGVAAAYLETLPGEPADDHTVVMVHVNAELLADTAPGKHAAPGGDGGDDEASAYVPAHLASPESVPAGTAAASVLGAGTCFVEGQGPIEAATARRLVCTSRLVGVLVDQHGGVLALGRTTRLASRAQRRALRVRERGVCQFPGCHQTRHVEAHHMVPWASGGRTDLDNLVLLCRAHHTLLHEGGLTIERVAGRHALAGRARYAFLMPDGQPIDETWRADLSADDLTWSLSVTAATRLAGSVSSGDAVGCGFVVDGRPADEAPGDGVARLGARGEGFNLIECVGVLFGAQLPDAVAA